MQMFALGSGMFMIAQVLGILVGFLNLKLPEFSQTMPVSSSAGYFLVAFVIATAALILLLKFVHGSMFFKLMLAAMMFLGAEVVFTTFMPQWVSIIVSGALVLIRFIRPTVFIQNFMMTLAVAGIGANIGLILPVGAVILIMLVLSVYDYIAVFKTGHMIRLFQGLVTKHVHLSIVIPSRLKDFTTKVDDARPGVDKSGERKFMMLGTGDIAFPIIFAVAAVRHSIFSGVSVLFGAFFGVALVYEFLLKSKKGAIPALPPIALCTITTFLLSLIVEWLAVIT